MNEWVEREDGRVDAGPQDGPVVRGILLEQKSVVGAVSFGPKEKLPLTKLRYEIFPTKTTSNSTAASSAGSTKLSDSPTLQELKDSIAIIITQLISLVDSFVCNVIATSKKGSHQNG